MGGGHKIPDSLNKEGQKISVVDFAQFFSPSHPVVSITSPKVASGRTHNIVATCCGTPATTASCQLAALPQHTHNCCEYSQQVRSGRLATSFVATTCCQSWTCPNSRNMLRMLWECFESPLRGAQVYVLGDWQQMCGLLWETCCQSVVSVDPRPP